jgi:Putative prokaryotic signal transducing protein
MAQKGGRCPRCGRAYPWGTTVCPTCHVALDLASDPPVAAPAVVVFQTGDRPSADIVAGLLMAHGLSCAIRGTDDAAHGVSGWTGYWHVVVRNADEATAQAILDAEIGREAED